MGELEQCSGCTNTKSGAAVYVCKNCGYKGRMDCRTGS